MQLILLADAIRAALAGAGFRLVAAFAQTVTPVAVAALWQGAAVAVTLVLCLRLAPRISAEHRFAVWTAGFAVVVALPFLSFLVPAAAGARVASPLSDSAVRPWLQLDSRWGLILAVLWFIASAFRAAAVGFHALRLRKLWKTATPVEADGRLRALLVSVSPARRAIQLCTTRELDRPSVIGFFAPRILVPEWLYSRLTPGELEQVILHEAEHLRRRDDWTNLLQKISLVLFPLNPALFWMERRLCREREMACDEGVVRRTQAPRAYAACLTSLAERGLEQRELLRRDHALSLGAFERRPELARRVHRILGCRQALDPLVARTLIGVVGCGLLVGSLEMARSPQLVAFVAAQKPDPQAFASARAQNGTTGIESASSRPKSELVFKSGAASLRAIQTKAILPATRSAGAPLASASLRRNAQQPVGAAEAEVAGTNAASRQELAMAAAPESVATSAQQPEYIVFTTWEEVHTLPQRSLQIADYDTSAGAQHQNSATGQPNSRPAAQITITRLILALYPASSAPSPKSAHATGSNSGRPAPALPIESGWLVFQL